jgi:hypothetical protein
MDNGESYSIFLFQAAIAVTVLGIFTASSPKDFLFSERQPETERQVSNIFDSNERARSVRLQNRLFDP